VDTSKQLYRGFSACKRLRQCWRIQRETTAVAGRWREHTKRKLQYLLVFYLASSLVACIVKDRYQDCRSEEQRKQKFLRNLEGCCAGVPKGAVAIENENYMEAILACVIERQSGAEQSRDAVGLIVLGFAWAVLCD